MNYVVIHQNSYYQGQQNQPLLLAIFGFIALASGTILNIVIGADKMP